MSDNKDKGVSELSFEQTIKELASIVAQVEQGQIPLQESLEQYEKGMTLIKHCRQILEQAEKRIEKISGSKAQEDADE